MFKTTKAEDVKVGDVEQQLVEEKRKYVYYYYRAESVFVGDKVEPLHDGITGEFVGNRTTNCVEIVWKPLNYDGKTFTTRYHPLATLDVASNLEDISDLVQEEDATE